MSSLYYPTKQAKPVVLNYRFTIRSYELGNKVGTKRILYKIVLVNYTVQYICNYS